MKRPEDIERATTEAVEAAVRNEFSEADRRSGYARRVATWWIKDIVDALSDEEARRHLGISV